MNFVEWTTTVEALWVAAVIGIFGVILFIGSFAIRSIDDERTGNFACVGGCELIALSLMLISMCASASDDTLGTYIMAVMALVFAAFGVAVLIMTERHQV